MLLLYKLLIKSLHSFFHLENCRSQSC